MFKKSVSVRLIIIVAVIFALGVVCFNAYDLTRDNSRKYYYTQQEIEELEIEKVNINTATKEQLCLLDGIGESTAENIVKYRQENGNFEKIEDIQNVKNISEQTFLKIRPMITV